MSQTTNATSSPDLRIDLFLPLKSQDDYRFDENTGRYVLGPKPSNVSETQTKIDMYNAATEAIEPLGSHFDGKSGEQARSVIRTAVAALRLQRMGRNRKMSSELRSRCREVLEDGNTKSIIRPLMRTLLSCDPGVSEALKTIAMAEDICRGFETYNPVHWPAMVRDYSKHIEDWVAWESGHKSVSGVAHTPQITSMGGSRAPSSQGTATNAPRIGNHSEDGFQSDDDFDPGSKWTPSDTLSGMLDAFHSRNRPQGFQPDGNGLMSVQESEGASTAKPRKNGKGNV